MKVNKMFFLNVMISSLFGLLMGCNETIKEKKDTVELKEKNDYVKGELNIQHGMELFNQHCASCHSFMGNEIGPSLSGVTSQVDKEWLISFIKEPKTKINSGDKRAAELYEKYKIYMPAFPNLKDEEIEDLLGFIHMFSEAEKRNSKARAGAILNPIVEKIPTSDLSLVIEEWLTIPPSSDSDPFARINKLAAYRTIAGERMFIADLRGKLYEVINDTVRVYLDFNEEEKNFINKSGWGTGLGSFDFHPEFESNGLFYTTHTEPSKTAPADFSIPDSIEVSLQWVITEWRAEKPKSPSFSGIKREILRADMVTHAHGFQELTFNPTAKKGEAEYGKLYLGIGDGGSVLKGQGHLCDSDNQIWGSIIRIDPAGRNSKNGNYGIPNDNPFVGKEGKLEEIWAKGFRNPHRITWNKNKPSQMLVSNIGQHSVEELDLVKKGLNYGWPNREGTFLYDAEANTEVVYPLPENDSTYSYPVVQYDHDEGNAISGGFVYTGNLIPILKGKYIFGDIPRGTLFYTEANELKIGLQAELFKLGLEFNGKTTDLGEITKSERVNLRFGVDANGELLIFTKSNGKVYKVVGCKIQDQKAS